MLLMSILLIQIAGAYEFIQEFKFVHFAPNLKIEY